MLLAASTALSKDRAAYASLARFTHRLGAVLTVLHALLAFTPLFDWLLVPALEMPAEIVEPARLGLGVMLPWTWAIASRRFHQGVLIRFGESRAVGVGTVVRLLAGVCALGVCYFVGAPGIVTATSAVIAGVLVEAVYAAVRIRPVLRDKLPRESVAPVVRGWAFARFYVPLGLTSLLTLLTLPIGSAAIGRMPDPVASLAVWPVVNALAFMLQAPAMAYVEVVVALLGDDVSRWRVPLRRFANAIVAGTTLVILGFCLTPLANLWFGPAVGLAPPLQALALLSLWFAVPVPALRGIQAWYQGVLVHHHQTRGVTESVAVFLLICVAILIGGIVMGGYPGAVVAIFGMTMGRLVQTLWLWARTRAPLRIMAAGQAR
jgi:hypothetical protein